MCTWMRGNRVVSFFPRILWRNRDFLKGSVCGKITFQIALGERVFGRNLNFRISVWGSEKCDFWQFIALLGISDMKNQNFLRPWRINPKTTISPRLSRHKFDVFKSNEILWKKGSEGGYTFESALGEIIWRRNWKVLFCLRGALTLNDTMTMAAKFLSYDMWRKLHF